MGAWHLEIAEGSDTLVITSSGVMTAALFEALAREAIALAAPRGIRRFLADHRAMVPEITTTEIFAIPESVRRLGLPPDALVAIVMGPDSPWRRDFQFLEDVAQNRSVFYRIFATVEEARAWLDSR